MSRTYREERRERSESGVVVEGENESGSIARDSKTREGGSRGPLDSLPRIREDWSFVFLFERADPGYQ